MSYKELVEQKLKEDTSISAYEKEEIIKLWQDIAEAYEKNGKDAIRDLILSRSEVIIKDFIEQRDKIEKNYFRGGKDAIIE